MYKNPEKFSMPFQSYVFLTMLQMHTKETEHPIKLMERSLYSARSVLLRENVNVTILTIFKFLQIYLC